METGSATFMYWFYFIFWIKLFCYVDFVKVSLCSLSLYWSACLHATCWLQQAAFKVPLSSFYFSHAPILSSSGSFQIHNYTQIHTSSQDTTENNTPVWTVIGYWEYRSYYKWFPCVIVVNVHDVLFTYGIVCTASQCSAQLFSA